MRKDFYLFRHGETDYNREHRWQGCGCDTPLNETGLAQARNLADRLKPLKLEIIFSSPLQRARTTAEICAAALDLPLQIEPLLRESCFGRIEGKTRDEIMREYPQIYQQWYSANSDLDIRFPGGESKRETQRRMLQALEKIAEAPHSRFGIATHGSSLRYLLYYFKPEYHKIENAQLFHLIWQDGRLALAEDQIK